ncbi:MAG: hypothetical protein PHX34_01630 [Candidatus Shapirobacteria bacterium]|nr:hypothetical protein [Candidatus Shapirobacteria bacterium]
MRKIVVIKNKTELGQSLIEIVFSIGIIALVITASVVLIVSAVGVKNNNFERKKATEMAEVLVENLVNKKQNDESNFWNLVPESDKTLSNFDGYKYSVQYNSDGISCSGDCTNAVVTINWGNDQSLTVSRFFSREVN